MSVEYGYNTVGMMSPDAFALQEGAFSPGGAFYEMNQAMLNEQNYGSPVAPQTEIEREDPVLKFYREQAAAEKAQRQQNASAVMKGLLEQLGLTSLYDRVLGYIKDGYDADAIQILIRTTPEYKQRFPAMAALTAKGRAISESEYIAYEQTAAGLERRYGLPQGMLMGNVTSLLENEVSPTELNDRVGLAAAAAFQAPPEVRDQFSQYYNIGTGGMTAYFLDPQIATPLLEKQYAASIIGSEATRQGVNVDVFGAERLTELGISQEQARQGFGTVAGARELTQGRGDVVTEQQLIGSTFGTDQTAQQAVERATGARRGRFQQGGEFVSSRQGVEGLGTATR